MGYNFFNPPQVLDPTWLGNYPSYAEDFDGWVAEFMLGYPTRADDWGNVTKSIPELKPASYYSKYYNGLDPISGMVTFEADGKTKLPEPVQVTEEQYRAVYEAMNYYVNGGKTPAGRVGGIDPASLLGGTKTAVDGFDDKVVKFPNGSIYEYAHAPSSSNDQRGENARFYARAGAPASWVGDLYDGTQFNSNYGGVFPDHDPTKVS